MSSRMWAWIRLAGGAAVLAVIVWRLGTGPIVDGIRTISVTPILAVVAITLGTTAASAYRWSLVADALGVGIGRRAAIAAYYRSQFLNTALPGGVLGDAHRAVRHGQDAGDVSSAARAVVWERVAGQIVQAVLTLVVLALFPSPVRHDLPLTLGIVAAVVALIAVLAVKTRGRIMRTIRSDVRTAVWSRRTRAGIAGSSAIVVAGHTTSFLIAARTAGTHASVPTLLPIALLVLLAMALPVNVGGWGPREGAAAWLFGAAGLGAAAGVSTATVYGVLVLIASLPGAVVLVLARRRHAREEATPDHAPRENDLVGAVSGRHG